MIHIKYGDRVVWTYEHHLNSRSSTFITKVGVFEGLIKHTVKHKGEQLALVTFDGNKGQSKIPFEQLKTRS